MIFELTAKEKAVQLFGNWEQPLFGPVCRVLWENL